MAASSVLPALLTRAAANPDKPIRTARNSAYPHQLWWFITSFIALVALCNWASWAIARYSSKRRVSHGRTVGPEAGGSPLARCISWRRLPLAIVNAFRVVAFRWTLDIGDSLTVNSAELFVLAVYIIALFTWEFVNTTNVSGGKLDVNYWENRAGVLGASQLALITALGTKNNILSYVTGVSYDKLKFVHRMIARVVFVLLWVHGGARIAHFPSDDSYSDYWVRLGLTAMGAFSLLILVSTRSLRARAYELFYIAHCTLVLIILLRAYFHANDQKFGFYVWPCFIIWGLDRVLRLARLVYYNHLYFGLSPASKKLDASLELLSPHLVRLHLQRPPHFRWTPGQTAFLMMPSVAGFPLEAHPFTIASVDDADFQPSANRRGRDAEKDAAAAEAGGADPTPYWKELVFLINVREGFTRRLADIAERNGQVKVLVNGPYGFSPNLDNDDTVVLVAGGSGVSYTLSTFLGVLSRVKKNKSKCTRLVFIWAIREASHIEWVSDALAKALDLAPSDMEIAIRIFVTSGDATSLAPGQTPSEDDSVHSSENTDPEKTRASSLLNLAAVQVSVGRPDLPALLRNEIESGTGRLSVTVCGSQGIKQACRSALKVPITSVLRGGPSVVLHVESFGYA
ncbi:iron reductase [Trametes elegans]|nr:iron reductase [Trametes elegans]